MHRHGRYYIACGAGLAAGLLAVPLSPEFRVLLAGNVFFLVYLALMAAFAARITPGGLRARAAVEDEGVPLIMVITLAAVILSLAAIVSVLIRQAGESPLSAVLAVASVPLGWAMVHTLAAFHYANLYYAPTQGEGQDSRGLVFPGAPEPGAWEFLYFAFVIGMTAQVSDVGVATSQLRRAVLAHGVVSFFYNTVILALAVNVAVGFGGWRSIG